MKNISEGVLLNGFKNHKKSHLCLDYTFLIFVNTAREFDKSYTINHLYFGLKVNIRAVQTKKQFFLYLHIILNQSNCRIQSSLF